MQFRARDTERARRLRREATPAERRLWAVLRGSQLGAKFSRQMPVGPWFADFLCRQRRLVIEVDGYSHELRAEHDAARDRWMAENGYRVVRFSNEEVMGNPEGVRVRILAVLAGED